MTTTDAMRELTEYEEQHLSRFARGVLVARQQLQQAQTVLAEANGALEDACALVSGPEHRVNLDERTVEPLPSQAEAPQVGIGGAEGP